MEIKRIEVGDGPTLKAEVGGEPTLEEICQLLSAKADSLSFQFSGLHPAYSTGTEVH